MENFLEAALKSAILFYVLFVPAGKYIFNKLNSLNPIKCQSLVFDIKIFSKFGFI